MENAMFFTGVSPYEETCQYAAADAMAKKMADLVKKPKTPEVFRGGCSKFETFLLRYPSMEMGNYLRRLPDAETEPERVPQVEDVLPLQEDPENVVSAEMSFFAFSIAHAAF